MEMQPCVSHPGLPWPVVAAPHLSLGGQRMASPAGGSQRVCRGSLGHPQAPCHFPTVTTDDGIFFKISNEVYTHLISMIKGLMSLIKGMRKRKELQSRGNLPPEAAFLFSRNARSIPPEAQTPSPEPAAKRPEQKVMKDCTVETHLEWKDSSGKQLQTRRQETMHHKLGLLVGLWLSSGNICMAPPSPKP
ncbi:uncharacterized protein LOC143664680 [Tamandua tetradactyla]|uniref:uncharacterized protein LOC143664680 n=1 Tax=Tamandua tetradactyla TaxID=48850 RepID=UPI0040548001